MKRYNNQIRIMIILAANWQVLLRTFLTCRLIGTRATGAPACRSMLGFAQPNAWRLAEPRPRRAARRSNAHPELH